MFVDYKPTPTNPFSPICELCATDKAGKKVQAGLSSYFDEQWAPRKSAEATLQSDYIDALTIVSGGEDTSATPGYKNINLDLNLDAGGKYGYLCFHKEKYKPVGANTQAITELQLIVGKDAPTPAGFRKLNTDLSLDAGGDYVYLCYKVDDYDPATAIIAITAFWGTDEDVAPPYGFVKLPTDVNLNAGSKIIFLSYAKKGTTMIIDFHL